MAEWTCTKNFYDKETCDYIIEKSLQIKSKKATVLHHNKERDGKGFHVDESHRRSFVRWIKRDNDDLKFLYDDYSKFIDDVAKNYYKFEVTTLQNLQFTEYDESYDGEYKVHMDLNHDDYWDEDIEHHRKISFVLQLSDETTYEGGNFILNYANEPLPEEVKEQGTLISFPSYAHHTAGRVTKGKRYSLVAWLLGPRFTLQEYLAKPMDRAQLLHLIKSYPNKSMD